MFKSSTDRETLMLRCMLIYLKILTVITDAVRLIFTNFNHMCVLLFSTRDLS